MAIYIIIVVLISVIYYRFNVDDCYFNLSM